MVEVPGRNSRCLRLKSIPSHHFGRSKVCFIHTSVFSLDIKKKKAFQRVFPKYADVVLFCSLVLSISCRLTKKASMQNNGKHKLIFWNANKYDLHWKSDSVIIFFEDNFLLFGSPHTRLWRVLERKPVRPHWCHLVQLSDTLGRCSETASALLLSLC